MYLVVACRPLLLLINIKYFWNILWVRWIWRIIDLIIKVIIIWIWINLRLSNNWSYNIPWWAIIHIWAWWSINYRLNLPDMIIDCSIMGKWADRMTSHRLCISSHSDKYIRYCMVMAEYSSINNFLIILSNLENRGR